MPLESAVDDDPQAPKGAAVARVEDVAIRYLPDCVVACRVGDDTMPLTIGGLALRVFLVLDDSDVPVPTVGLFDAIGGVSVDDVRGAVSELIDSGIVTRR